MNIGLSHIFYPIKIEGLYMAANFRLIVLMSIWPSWNDDDGEALMKEQRLNLVFDAKHV